MLHHSLVYLLVFLVLAWSGGVPEVVWVRQRGSSVTELAPQLAPNASPFFMQLKSWGRMDGASGGSYGSYGLLTLHDSGWRWRRVPDAWGSSSYRDCYYTCDSWSITATGITSQLCGSPLVTSSCPRVVRTYDSSMTELWEYVYSPQTTLDENSSNSYRHDLEIPEMLYADGSGGLLLGGQYLNRWDNSPIYTPIYSGYSSNFDTSWQISIQFSMSKFDLETGNRQWRSLQESVTYFPNDDTIIYRVRSVFGDTDGKAYMIGSLQTYFSSNRSYSDTTFHLMKWASGGSLEWKIALGTSFSSTCFGSKMTTDMAGNIFVLSVFCSPPVVGIWKFSSKGVLQWNLQRCTGCTASAFQATTFGDLIVVGSASFSVDGNSYQGDTDMFVMCINNSGAWQWTKQLGTAGEDFADSVYVENDAGALYVAGRSDFAWESSYTVREVDVILIKMQLSNVSTTSGPISAASAEGDQQETQQETSRTSTASTTSNSTTSSTTRTTTSQSSTTSTTNTSSHAATVNRTTDDMTTDAAGSSTWSFPTTSQSGFGDYDDEILDVSTTSQVTLALNESILDEPGAKFLVLFMEVDPTGSVHQYVSSMLGIANGSSFPVNATAAEMFQTLSLACGAQLNLDYFGDKTPKESRLSDWMVASTAVVGVLVFVVLVRWLQPRKRQAMPSQIEKPCETVIVELESSSEDVDVINPLYMQHRVAIFNALHNSINQGATDLVVIHVTGGEPRGTSDAGEQLHGSHGKDSDAADVAALLKDLMKAKSGQHPLVGEGPWLRYFQSCSFRQVRFEHLAEELESATIQGRYAIVTTLSPDSRVEPLLHDFNFARPRQNGMAVSGSPHATCLTKPKRRSRRLSQTQKVLPKKPKLKS